MLDLKFNSDNLPSNSKDILSSLVGHKIIKSHRVFDWDEASYCEMFKVKRNQLFSLGYGPIGISFSNGRSLVFGVADIYQSVVVKELDVKNISLSDSDGFLVENNDATYSCEPWLDMYGEKVSSVHIFKVNSDDVADLRFPLEKAVKFEFSSGREMMISHGLCKEAKGDLNILSSYNLVDTVSSRVSIIDVAKLN